MCVIDDEKDTALPAVPLFPILGTFFKIRHFLILHFDCELSYK